MLMALGQKNEACVIWSSMIEKNIRKEEAEESVKKYCSSDNGTQMMLEYYNNIRAASFLNNGVSEAGKGKYDVALARFDSCLKYAPQNKDALYNKALMHYKLNEKKSACAWWEKALENSP